MMTPGYETSEVIELCAKADEIVRRFAAERQIPQYDPAFRGPTGGVPLVLMLAALIEENQHLRTQIRAIQEPLS